MKYLYCFIVAIVLFYFGFGVYISNQEKPLSARESLRGATICTWPRDPERSRVERLNREQARYGDAVDSKKREVISIGDTELPPDEQENLERIAFNFLLVRTEHSYRPALDAVKYESKEIYQRKEFFTERAWEEYRRYLVSLEPMRMKYYEWENVYAPRIDWDTKQISPSQDYKIKFRIEGELEHFLLDSVIPVETTPFALEMTFRPQAENAGSILIESWKVTLCEKEKACKQ